MRKEKNIEKLLGPWRDPLVSEKFAEKTGNTNHKFINRNRTIKINWTRLHSYAKDLLLSEKSLKILDVGCGNGATLEIFRHYGHEAIGLDKPQIYAPMIESQGLKSVEHDGASIPYPFKENEFDLVICWGAITFFKPVEKWPHILDELARLSKSAIILAPNVGQVYDKGRPFIENWRPSRGFKLAEKRENSKYRWDKKA
jgi:SAM-dependent methyltransferase